MCKTVETNKQETLTTTPTLDPSCGSGTDTALPPAQSTTSNVELSFDYLRTADVTRLSTSLKLKFPPRATLPDLVWETAWKLVKHHLLSKLLK